MIIVKNISAETTYPLRIEVLRDGIAINYKFKEDRFENTYHFGAFIEKECVGILTLIYNSNPLINIKSSYQLRGMAVCQGVQLQGIGKLLIEESYKFLKEKNCKIVWCNAREIAVSFYHKMGFSIIGDAFDIPNIGTHYVMSRNV